MKEELNTFIEFALNEDIREGDHTSLACIPNTAIGKAQLLVKENGVLAGMEVAQAIFEKVNPDIQFFPLMKDGESMAIGNVAFIVEGPSSSILTAERLVLNCMQRMSGIATKTRHIVQLLQGTQAKVLDTRKTTPGIRLLEKWAVKIGGGVNHRFGLYDMMMIKDNHIDFAGGIAAAIEKANNYQKNKGINIPIEVEARNLQEVDEILKAGNIQRIMLDNFSYADTRTAVERINSKYETEASGGITEETIRKHALCGVDFISVGALTHSVNSLDLSLKAI
ncbi:MAG: nicotinate-nucleotide diphosphorylase (carboxylating) [Flavobacteriales bacterium]|jgi:nicotinate-nucleotide pyrophosphorylase (carboxylating)|nr:nicotinate-nucleotide diphosphorylase (carboxylating) [Flavobacteriales bacterium]|tara:strand:- start:3312 stop:4151 length:840 start_codon:yes stop_codon:yes gene_type:complete